MLNLLKASWVKIEFFSNFVGLQVALWIPVGKLCAVEQSSTQISSEEEAGNASELEESPEEEMIEIQSSNVYDVIAKVEF